MVWKIEFTTSAEKEFSKVPFDVKKRITTYLKEKVSNGPRANGKSLIGSIKLWRYRIGDYRLICQIKDTELIVLVVRIGNRDQVYKNFDNIK